VKTPEAGAAAPFWRARGGLDLAAAALLPSRRELEVRFRGGQTYRATPASLGLAKVGYAVVGTDLRTLVIGLLDGDVHEVPSTAVLAVAEPAYREDVTRRARTPGERVRALRLAAGRTAMEVAAAAGMARSNFARLEAGTHEPRLATLRRVADALGVGLEALVG
jgi:DNA-binding XRE family transcriptional regulator